MFAFKNREKVAHENCMWQTVVKTGKNGWKSLSSWILV